MDNEENPEMSNGFLVVVAIIILLATAMVYVKYTKPVVVPPETPVLQSVQKDTAPEPRIYERDVKG